jgi:thiol-disulfide isomerase/thioredoxin
MIWYSLATWCGKCKIVAEELNRLSDEYPNAIFCEANIDESDFPQGKEEAQIESIPTVHFIKNDEFLGQSVGVKVNDLRQQIETFSKDKGNAK